MARVSRLSFRNMFRLLPAWGILVLVTTVVSVAFFISLLINPETIRFFALQPASILSGQYLWTLVTHMFVHGGLLHLFMNMFVLFSLGSLCERLIGRKRFVWLYLIAGVVAGALSVYASGFFGTGVGVHFFGSADEYMVGASGAIFALAGVLMVLLPRLRFSIIFLPFFSLPAYVMVPLVLFATWLLSIAAGWNIGNVAHFGGFLVGALYGYYLRLRYRRKVLLLERYFR